MEENKNVCFAKGESTVWSEQNNQIFQEILFGLQEPQRLAKIR